MSTQIRLQNPSLLNTQNLYVNSRDSKFVSFICDPNENIILNDILIIKAFGTVAPNFRFTLGNGFNPIFNDFTLKTNNSAVIIEPFTEINMRDYLEVTFGYSDNMVFDSNGRIKIKTKNAVKVTLLWSTNEALIINDTVYNPGLPTNSIVPIVIGNGYTQITQDIDITGSKKVAYFIETIRKR